MKIFVTDLSLPSLTWQEKLGKSYLTKKVQEQELIFFEGSELEGVAQSKVVKIPDALLLVHVEIPAWPALDRIISLINQYSDLKHRLIVLGHLTPLHIEYLFRNGVSAYVTNSRSLERLILALKNAERINSFDRSPYQEILKRLIHSTGVKLSTDEFQAVTLFRREDMADDFDKESVTKEIFYLERQLAELLKRVKTSDLAGDWNLNPLIDLDEPKPISLIFDTEEISSDEIAEIIAALQDIYHEISGDELIIKGTSSFEYVCQPLTVD
jgi:hypothetical protein